MKIRALIFAVPMLMGMAFEAQSQTPPPGIKITAAPRTLPLTKFYDTPNPLPAGKPGDLIRFEPSYDYRLPYQILALRILYHSRSAAGNDLAVSAVVLLPRGAPPDGGWPVIAWAHHFNGSARQCAPSLFLNLDQGPLLSMYVSQGYAVVASDFAGLGTDFLYAAMDARSSATDVINAVPAARAALPQLGAKWVVAGHAEGGMVAVAVAETESEQADPNFLGAVAISGVADPAELFVRLAEGPDHRKLIFLAHGIKNVLPAFQIEDMLSEAAIPLYVRAEKSCESSFATVLTTKEMFKTGWENNSFVRQFFARNDVAQHPVRSPLLLISGDADPDVPSFVTAKVVNRLCQLQDKLVFVKFPNLNASGVVSESIAEQNSWIRSRFLGRPAPSNCP